MPSSDPVPARKPRHDGFHGPRRRTFLDALGKGGCVRDAARAAGVSPQTVYNHQRADPGFMRQCELALDMAGTDVELHAWERGVVGVEEPVFNRAGEVVGHRRKRSDAILRLLLQATKPKKYGPMPGFRRRLVAKAERREIERAARKEMWAEMQARKDSPEEVTARLREKLRELGRIQREQRRERGWTNLFDDIWIPPGYQLAPGARPLTPEDVREVDVV